MTSGGGVGDGDNVIVKTGGVGCVGSNGVGGCGDGGCGDGGGGGW